MKYFFRIALLSLIQISQLAAQQNEAHLEKIQVGKKNRYVLFPVVVKSPEYIWGGGAAGTLYFKLKRDSLTRTSNFKGVGFYTLRKQTVVATEGYVYFPAEAFILHTIATFSHFPDKFWGLGNTTPNSNLERYTISQYDLYPQILKNIYSKAFIGVGYEFQNVYKFNYNNDGTSRFDTENVTGRNGGHISGTGVIFTWDSRNNSFSPSKGLYAQYSITNYNTAIGSDFNFVINNLDIRKFFSFKHDWVLGMQFNIISTNGNTPIRNMANIGTNAFMRGYYEGRYTDKNLAALQTEIRTPIWKRFGAVVFAGAGRVGRRFGDLWEFKDLKPSIGFGLRFAINPKEKLNLRVDSGFGRKSHGTYINMGEAF